MSPAYAALAGVSKFTKSRPDKTFQAIVKGGFGAALDRCEISIPVLAEAVDGWSASCFSDRFKRQPLSGIMTQDYLGPVPRRRRS